MMPVGFFQVVCSVVEQVRGSCLDCGCAPRLDKHELAIHPAQKTIDLEAMAASPVPANHSRLNIVSLDLWMRLPIPMRIGPGHPPITAFKLQHLAHIPGPNPDLAIVVGERQKFVSGETVGVFSGV